MSPLERALHERIRSEGPISVEEYMDACNAFYYATRDPLGEAGGGSGWGTSGTAMRRSPLTATPS